MPKQLSSLYLRCVGYPVDQRKSHGQAQIQGGIDPTL